MVSKVYISINWVKIAVPQAGKLCYSEKRTILVARCKTHHAILKLMKKETMPKNKFSKSICALIALTVLSACEPTEAEAEAKAALNAVKSAVTSTVEAVSPESSPSVKVTSNISIAPHKALYEFKLISAKRNSQIANVKGKMAFEWENTCDAWTTNQNYKIRYDYMEGVPAEMSSNFATWESKDGNVFQFSATRMRDDIKVEDIRGSVTRGEDGTMDVKYKLPEGLKIEAPVGTTFPTQHTAQLLEAALEGKKLFPAVLFDGSDTEGPVDVSAVITKVVEPTKDTKENKNVDKDLLASKAWSVRLAFFPRKSPTSDPELELSEASDYEMTMIIHENGVISDMTIDYSDFSLRSTLTALEKIKSPTCD